MIGKGKSISHTSASMGYGWNQEKNAKVVFRQHLTGENPNEITKEFKRIQALNHNCRRNTLSFVLSPTIKDGKRLKNKDLNKLVSEFIQQMRLKNHQAIAFVHKDKEHTHIHLYANRIDFKGKAYNDSFIGKQSQLAAEKVAEQLQLTTVKQVLFERDFDTREIKSEVKRRHELTLKHVRPKNFEQYIEGMAANGVKVTPTINKQNQLQGFRFKFDGFDFKGSEVHRKMSIGNIGRSILNHTTHRNLISPENKVKLAGKWMVITNKTALSLSKSVIKKNIQRGIGY
ncbi:relaxase/mobilization nuclease domain-containing protein [Zobellia uliginosa]|uniref:relaxase/mobilization nuclease domain-containing protein n=1 Tax=Zobellia uliginosa TaxID=143224 RepID=UPI0026E445C3|nr:relaxase/mobilization nuclease domain-containing protein [Zobellia uliginosa]MDO6516569.1 relaxase/mobilization nuclease domain-containing protein [Zobellia uliginosa]